MMAMMDLYAQAENNHHYDDHGRRKRKGLGKRGCHHRRVSADDGNNATTPETRYKPVSTTPAERREQFLACAAKYPISYSLSATAISAAAPSLLGGGGGATILSVVPKPTAADPVPQCGLCHRAAFDAGRHGGDPLRWAVVSMAGVVHVEVDCASRAFVSVDACGHRFHCGCVEAWGARRRRSVPCPVCDDSQRGWQQ